MDISAVNQNREKFSRVVGHSPNSYLTLTWWRSVNTKGEIVKEEKGQAQYFSEDLGNRVMLGMVAIVGGSLEMVRRKVKEIMGKIRSI